MKINNKKLIIHVFKITLDVSHRLTQISSAEIIN
jgi:hypothetical protein